ncbi:hypothetical protein DSO57_1036846 [Entomophthora muscae]|uniref:Uncharacterized protein n=1 Tax=Entomophthora muscae TaxID=34485 RepID=A0ACC2SN42_9FUNG|nr:hypothetical protein DSO57_1036846 [Entomophthora muscae]
MINTWLKKSPFYSQPLSSESNVPPVLTMERPLVPDEENAQSKRSRNSVLRHKTRTIPETPETNHDIIVLSQVNDIIEILD